MIDFALNIFNTLKKWFPVAFAELTPEQESEYLDMIKRLFRQSCRSIMALDVAPVELSFHRNYNGIKMRVISRIDDESKTNAMERLDMLGDILLITLKALPVGVIAIWAGGISDGR